MTDITCALRPIVAVRKRGPRAIETWFEAPQLARSVKPGQFVMLRWPASLDPLLPRPMSVYGVAEIDGRSCASVVYTVMGAGTARLAALVPGNELSVFGPLGHGFSVPPGLGAALLVAGGIGIAGLALLATELVSRGVPTRLVFGARSAEDLVMLEEFESRGIEVAIATEDGSRGQRGRVTEPLLTWIRGRSLEGERLYACGPTPMLRAIQTLAREHDLDTELALEARMACGFGICLGCAVPASEPDAGFRLVCKDGPVFPRDAVRL